MPFSPSANMLARAIDASHLSIVEVTDRCGIGLPSTLDEMRQGVLQIPIGKILDLARVLNIDERKFLTLAIQEYHPGVYEVLVETLGIQARDAELGVLTMFRMANIRGQIEIEEPFRKTLGGLLDLARLAR